MARKKTGVELADHLTEQATSGFKLHHDNLKRANEIYEEERLQREADAAAWRDEIDAAIAEAEHEAQLHAARVERNNRVIGKLSELI